jgi:hypothetical protein
VQDVVVVLGDGSSLRITGLEPSAAPTQSPPEEGTLSTVQEVQSFVSEAIAAGITFELLKTLVLSLARGGHLMVRRTATADDVRNTLQRYAPDLMARCAMDC